MHADLTVIDADLFRAAPPAVLKARIVATIVAGRVAYEREVEPVSSFSRERNACSIIPMMPRLGRDVGSHQEK